MISLKELKGYLYVVNPWNTGIYLNYYIITRHVIVNSSGAEMSHWTSTSHFISLINICNIRNLTNG